MRLGRVPCGTVGYGGVALLGVDRWASWETSCAKHDSPRGGSWHRVTGVARLLEGDTPETQPVWRGSSVFVRSEREAFFSFRLKNNNPYSRVGWKKKTMACSINRCHSMPMLKSTQTPTAILMPMSMSFFFASEYYFFLALFE